MRHNSPTFGKNLAVSAAAVTATAMLGSLASGGVRSRWYAELDKPAIQPPGFVFPIVWTALYSDIAVSSAVAIEALQDPRLKAAGKYRRALAVNLILGACWTWVFFQAHKPLPAIAVAAALATSSADLARRTGQANPIAGIALTPYAAWCSFATVLTAAIWRRNR
jgi:translocator protein